MPSTLSLKCAVICRLPKLLAGTTMTPTELGPQIFLLNQERT